MTLEEIELAMDKLSNKGLGQAKFTELNKITKSSKRIQGFINAVLSTAPKDVTSGEIARFSLLSGIIIGYETLHH